MNLSFLPNKLLDALKNVDTDKLYEIRLRSDFPVLVKYDALYYYLKSDGLDKAYYNAIKCDDNDINIIINNLTERSIYAYVDKLKKGFLTSKEGVRVGLAGECVFEKEIITIKNIKSINVRVPHQINGCSNEIIKYVYNNGKIENSLIISPPFCGKTTILKDLANNINLLNNYNVLLVDERGEFECVKGERIDSIKYCDKSYAFEYGIRSMSPDVIITDELSSDSDWECVKNASLSGVNVIASCHAYNINDLLNKKYFSSGVFNRYFVLKSNKSTPGMLNDVYDGDLNKVL